MPRLQQENRERALGMLDNGASRRQVAARFGVHVSTIDRLVNRFRATGSTRDRPRPGQRRVTTANQDRYIVLRHLRNRFKTATSTSRETRGVHGRNISADTVRRRLKARGIRCRRPYKGQILTRRHRAERTRWAALHAQQNWANVVFSDESRFNLSNSDGRVRVYRRQGERFADNCVLERDRFGGGSVMVWGAINHNFKSDLVVIDGNLTAQRYVDDVLNPHLLPLLYQHGHHLLFQQDNARPHTARITRNFFAVNAVNTLQWPSRSPDLNPIEHLWDQLGKAVRNRAHQPRTLQELANALLAEWGRIPQYRVRALCRSMDRRVVACRRADGGHTRY